MDPDDGNKLALSYIGLKTLITGINVSKLQVIHVLRQTKNNNRVSNLDGKIL